MGHTKQTDVLSCYLYLTDMPTAINAFANTYLFVVTERHCVYLLPLYMVDLCGVSVAHQYCSFFKFSWVLQLYAIYS